MRRRVLLLIAAAACGSPQPAPMFPAGSERDDGYGDLAQASARLLIGNGSDAAPLTSRRPRRVRADGDGYGGDAYGGASYGAGGPITANGAPIFTALPGGPAAPPAVPRYTPTTGLTGAIEGTVTWRGPPPPPLTTTCGAIDNPSVRVAANRGVAGVLVYIEHVEIGRPLPAVGRPATVGGIVAKRGCALGPPAQILTPLPADLAIHGDATEARLRITLPGASARPVELQPGGRLVVAAQPGVIQIAADDDSLGPAWVVAANTPYYAITDERGRFRIDELATGRYDVTFWQPPLAATANGKLVHGAPVVVHRAVNVDAARPARIDLALPLAPP
jgi:hypothetical protein